MERVRERNTWADMILKIYSSSVPKKSFSFLYTAPKFLPDLPCGRSATPKISEVSRHNLNTLERKSIPEPGIRAFKGRERVHQVCETKNGACFHGEHKCGNFFTQQDRTELQKAL